MQFLWPKMALFSLLELLEEGKMETRVSVMKDILCCAGDANLFSKMCRPILEPNQDCIQWVLEFFPGDKLARM